MSKRLFALILVPCLPALAWRPTIGRNGVVRGATARRRKRTCRRGGRPRGENVAWSLNFGGRSAPVVFGNRLVPADRHDGRHLDDAGAARRHRRRQRQDRLGAQVQHLPVATCRSTAPAGRRRPSIRPLATSTCSPSARSSSRSGPMARRYGSRSLPEEYGAITTHGGRTTSPIVEGDKVILNTLIQNWGPDLGRPGNRYFAFDKRPGRRSGSARRRRATTTRTTRRRSSRT